MKKDLEKYVRFYKNIQQIERCLRHATDLARELDIDAVLADKMEMARQGIEDHLDQKFGGKPAIWEAGGFQHSEDYSENQDQLLCRSINTCELCIYYITDLEDSIRYTMGFSKNGSSERKI